MSAVLAMPRIAPASSPWQRICDALAAEPSRLWTLGDLAKVGACSWEDARLCLRRLIIDGLLVHHVGHRWRAADRPQGGQSWW